jgi:hypothetical protein
MDRVRLRDGEAIMATPFNLRQSAPGASTWFARNWKWVLPLGILLLLLLFASFVGSILFIVESSFRHSDCYVQALARAGADPQVVEKIGQPIEAGWTASGSINVSGPSGDADISIPISGPKGKGTVYLVAKKSAGRWEFQTLQIEVQGEKERIDLLRPPDSGPGGA